MALTADDVIVKGKKSLRIIKEDGGIQGNPFVLVDLEDCLVLLLDHSDSVTIENCRESRIFIGPCSGSVFLRNCKSCNVSVYSKQLRLRDCTQCKLRVLVNTDPVIEASQEVSFSTVDFEYSNLDEHAQKASVDMEVNKFDQVYDFDKSVNEAPHWTLEAAPVVSDIWQLIQSQNSGSKLGEFAENWTKIQSDLVEDMRRRDEREQKEREKIQSQAKEFLEKAIVERSQQIQNRRKFLKDEEDIYQAEKERKYQNTDRKQQWNLVWELLPSKVQQMDTKQGRMLQVMRRCKG